MGDEEQKMDLAISNPPATKVGNMRIAQKRREVAEKPLSRSEYLKQAEEYNSELVAPPKHDFATQQELEFHDTTVMHTQQKPFPQVSKPTKPVQHFIRQPRSD
uniref:SUZ domain-containing protein n=1 Tax=Mesocestoides corti TaxID=53468 RepID=A0A5K3FQ66_MESCO